MSHSYSRSGGEQYITVVALSDNTEVRIQRPDEEVFTGPTSTGSDSGSGSLSNVQTYNLNAGQSVRFVSYYTDMGT